MSVSVDFAGSSGTGKKAIEKVCRRCPRGIHKISDDGLDPTGHIFDDSGWIVIKQVGDAGANSYALEVQLSIVEGASVNNMLLRFRSSFTRAVLVRAGAAAPEINSACDKVLLATIDKLLDEAQQEFETPGYRRGWHPIPVPRPAG